jgi:fused signal recognition particle receptor
MPTAFADLTSGQILVVALTLALIIGFIVVARALSKPTDTDSKELPAPEPEAGPEPEAPAAPRAPEPSTLPPAGIPMPAPIEAPEPPKPEPELPETGTLHRPERPGTFGDVPNLAPAQTGDKAPEAAPAVVVVEVPKQVVVPAPAPAPAPEPTAPAPATKPVTSSLPSVAPAGRSLSDGVAKTREGFIGRLTKVLFRKKEIDKDIVGELEEVLFTSDIGVKVAEKLLAVARESLNAKQITDPAAVEAAIRAEILKILTLNAPPVDVTNAKPFVLMVVGVNGVGKTTTIGKLAARYRREGHGVVLAAGDTFRAAAVEQLQVWGERSGAKVIAGKENGDPASVAFEAVKAAQADGAQIVIADTAGRLHTKVNLMEELAKVQRVIGKAQEGAPHEVWLVLDATTGQNALQQARQFGSVLKGLTGIVLTKLDGTAKGGVIIGIADELKVPVRYIGIGEGVDDLRPFDADAFVDALFAK